MSTPTRLCSFIVFSAWPGSGTPLSRDLEAVLYKFWLINVCIKRLNLTPLKLKCWVTTIRYLTFWMPFALCCYMYNLHCQSSWSHLVCPWVNPIPLSCASLCTASISSMLSQFALCWCHFWPAFNAWLRLLKLMLYSLIQLHLTLACPACVYLKTSI